MGRVGKNVHCRTRVDPPDEDPPLAPHHPLWSTGQIFPAARQDLCKCWRNKNQNWTSFSLEYNKRQIFLSSPAPQSIPPTHVDEDFGLCGDRVWERVGGGVREARHAPTSRPRFPCFRPTARLLLLHQLPTQGVASLLLHRQHPHACNGNNIIKQRRDHTHTIHTLRKLRVNHYSTGTVITRELRFSNEEFTIRKQTTTNLVGSYYQIREYVSDPARFLTTDFTHFWLWDAGKVATSWGRDIHDEQRPKRGIRSLGGSGHQPGNQIKLHEHSSRQPALWLSKWLLVYNLCIRS